VQTSIPKYGVETTNNEAMAEVNVRYVQVYFQLYELFKSHITQTE
jgi:hypothetical protein